MRRIDTRNFSRATRTTPKAINRQIALNLVREHQPDLVLLDLHLPDIGVARCSMRCKATSARRTFPLSC